MSSEVWKGHAIARGPLMQVRNAEYWWRGGQRKSGTLPAVCTNPLTWTAEGAAPAAANPGSLPSRGGRFRHTRRRVSR